MMKILRILTMMVTMTMTMMMMVMTMMMMMIMMVMMMMMIMMMTITFWQESSTGLFSPTSATASRALSMFWQYLNNVIMIMIIMMMMVIKRTLHVFAIPAEQCHDDGVGDDDDVDETSVTMVMMIRLHATP